MSWDRDKEKKAGKAMTMSSLVFGLIFSIFWCVMAVSIGAWFMLFFGVPFVGMMAYRLYVFRQIAKENEKKEQQKHADPWDRPAVTDEPRQGHTGSGFCPYCGGGIQEGFVFCPKCGRRLPE